MKKLTILTLITLLISAQAYGWSGYDWETGSFIEIEPGNLVRPGEMIDYYDYNSGYHFGDVESIQSFGSGVEVEIYDYDSDEYRIFDMD